MIFWHHQFKKKLKGKNNEQFFIVQNNQRNNRDYLRLTPSYDVVILE